MLPSSYTPPNAFDGFVVDLFAGAGASEGLAQALGRDPDIAINHDSEVLAFHKVILVLWHGECVPCGHGGFFFVLCFGRLRGVKEPARRGYCAARWAGNGKGKGLSFGMGNVCPAGTGACFLFSLGRLRGVKAPTGGDIARRAGLEMGRGRACPLTWGMCALRARGLFLCSLFWPPTRRAARRGRLWGCAPFSAPLASPPKHPASGFQLPDSCEGCAAFAAGASLAALG